MSASREKKLRQGAGPVEKSAGSKQNANAKNKTILYGAVAAVVIVLVAALLIWDSGMIQRSTTAATIGETDYSPAEVSYYYTTAYQNAYMMAQYGLSAYNPLLTPQEQTLTTDSGEEMSYHDYFIDSALSSLHSITALYDAAIAAGYKESDVTDDVESAIATTETDARNSGYSSLKQWLISTMGKTMTLSTFRDIVTREAVANQYIQDYFDGLEYSEDELNAYYKEHANDLDTFEFGYLYFSTGGISTTDENGKALSDAEIDAAEKKALEAAKEKADSAAKQLEAAKAADRPALLEKLIEETESSFSAALETKVGADISGAVYFDWLSDDARKAGDVSVIDSGTSGYYVTLFLNKYLDETPSARIRHILINATTADSSSKPTEADMDFAKTELELLLQVWRAEGDTEENFATLAEANSGDGRDASGNLNAPGGLYDPVYKGDFVPSLNEWIFDTEAREPGQVGILENNGDSNYYGYHAVYFCGYNEGDFAWKATAKGSLANDEATAHRDELMANYTITEKSGLKYVFS